MKHMIFVHGLGNHVVGWSAAWQAAVAPWTPSVPAANVHEVLYADGLQQETRVPAKEVLAWAGEITATDPAFAQLATVDNRWLREIRLYFTKTALHAEALSRFTSDLIPLLAAGDTVFVLAHSWGGVVAYEGLFQVPTGLPGKVVLFTMGCPLHFRLVRRRITVPGQGPKEPYVRRWINLQVAGDIVGESLKKFGFPVDEDDTGLPILVQPAPTSRKEVHEIYKSPQELNIQRDIVGKVVEEQAA